jgi:hypothetical protein
MEANNYSHQLPQCGWGAHLGYHVPEKIDYEILVRPVKEDEPTDIIVD